MMKKSLVLLSTLLTITSISTMASANFYVGIAGGFTTALIDSKVTYPIDQPPVTIKQNINAGMLATGQLLLGYHQALTKRWGIDTVVADEINNGSVTNRISNWFDGNDANVEMKLPSILSINLLATAQIAENVAVFFGPGFSSAQFKASSGTTAGSAGTTGNFSKTLNGWQVSVGSDFFLNQTWRIRFSDEYKNYSAVTFSGVEPIAAEVVSSRYTPSANTLLIGIVASF